MKKNVLKTNVIIVFVLVFASLSVNSQVKVANNGCVKLGSTLTPNYKLDVKSAFSLLQRYDGSGYDDYKLAFSFYGSDPRIQAKDQVVFYDIDGGGFIDIECQTLIEHSDSSAKTDIEYLTSNSLNKVLNLNGVTYRWKNKDNHKSANNRKEIGFLAQEVEDVIPEVVFTNDSTDAKMLSYTHLIPVLTEAIKELNEKVVMLENLVNETDTRKSGSSIDNNGIKQTPLLYQNTPNPFDENTKIEYFIPEDCKNATINIFSLEGQPVKSIVLSGKGNSSISISSNELMAGMYVYALIVDGKIIDSKNMILTK